MKKIRLRKGLIRFPIWFLFSFIVYLMYVWLIEVNYNRLEKFVYYLIFVLLVAPGNP